MNNIEEKKAYIKAVDRWALVMNLINYIDMDAEDAVNYVYDELTLDIDEINRKYHMNYCYY